MNVSHIGRDIKALRVKRGLSSRSLSRLIGKSETYISQLERGLIKNPDYNTAFDIMKHLGYAENGIEQFLFDFYQISSPERIELEAEEVKEWEEKRAREIVTDPDHQVHFTADLAIFESEWMKLLYEDLESKNEQIKKELSFNIANNAPIFEKVINNLLSILTSMRKDRGNFDFFVRLFESDLSDLSGESKDKILKLIKNEIEKS